jgi:hypothetical protein
MALSPPVAKARCRGPQAVFGFRNPTLANCANPNLSLMSSQS